MRQSLESGWQGIEFLKVPTVGQTGYAKMVLNLASHSPYRAPHTAPTVISHSLHSLYQSKFILNTKVISQFKVELCSYAEIALRSTSKNRAIE